jgi:hypothetical protein
MKLKITNKTIFVVLFALLYLAVGLVSTIHAVQFFGLANSPVLGTILAVTFEIGQAAVLFNLLTNPSQRKKFMPWALMCILTIVQILGSIFSSYKYLITNSNENLRFFKDPIFVWTELPDQECNVIITYIVGAILPIVALCLTEMVVSYLGSEEESKQIEPVVEPVEETTPQEPVIEQPTIVDEPIIPISEDTKEAVNELIRGDKIEQHTVTPNRKNSHFINM